MGRRRCPGEAAQGELRSAAGARRPPAFPRLSPVPGRARSRPALRAGLHEEPRRRAAGLGSAARPPAAAGAAGDRGSEGRLCPAIPLLHAVKRRPVPPPPPVLGLGLGNSPLARFPRVVLQPVPLLDPGAPVSGCKSEPREQPPRRSVSVDGRPWLSTSLH